VCRLIGWNRTRTDTIIMTDLDPERELVGGVDTHGRTHHAAVIDAHLGRHLADREFAATTAGYRELAAWMSAHGRILAVGVEGTGAYGAGLARHLAEAGLTVVEVDRPDRKTRRAKGKSDPIDAYAAASAVAAGRAEGSPKTRTGTVEAIRALRVARSSAVKARTQAINQIRNLLVTSPGALREQLAGLPRAKLIPALARLRPGTDPAIPLGATKAALRHLARRHQNLDQEIAELDAQILPLVRAANPVLLEIFGLGPETAGQLLTTAGDNPERLHSEAAFAHLCGVAPKPASSGRTQRHRLNRGGDRQANAALYHAAIVAMCHHQPTRDYIARRTAEGLSTLEIIRCLKRYIAREIYHTLTSHQPAPTAQTKPHNLAA
jgi:transposase